MTFLIDTVSALKIPKRYIKTSFFVEHCKTTEENLFELKESEYLGDYSSLSLEITENILLSMIKVWEAIDNRDLGKKIIDLYGNKGNGDILLLSTALSEIELGRDRLFRDEWIVVTDDKGVSAVAKEINIKSLTTDRFISKYLVGK